MQLRRCLPTYFPGGAHEFMTEPDAALRTGQESAPSLPPQGRLRRSRITAKILARIAATRTGGSLLKFLGKFPPGRACLEWCAGFRKPFSSFNEARLCAATHLPFDHSHPDNATLHLRLAKRLRPSDYPVLFHLQKIRRIEGVFDLGGNVGNLFYSYRSHIPQLENAFWRVYDVPAIASMGESLARDLHESRLSFVSDVTSLGHADVFLASGSIHYFEESLAQMLAQQQHRPQHVFVNRTPFLSGDSTYTVQDAGTFLAACKLHSHGLLISEMQALGYECVDEWTVPELELIIPCFPELSARSYSGLYFRLQAI